jgi:hypothetical protein
MKTKFFNLLFAGLFISGVALTGCNKSEAIHDLNNNSGKIAAAGPDDDPHPYLQLLNQDLVVMYALDGANDITQQFAPYTFKFIGTEPSGQAQVTDGKMSQTGSWSMEVEPGDFGISYPTNVFTGLVFLNRNWTIEGSSSAVIRLVASDGDEVQLAAK